MKKIKNLIIREIQNSLFNNFIDNYDEHRFGKRNSNSRFYIKRQLKEKVFPNLISKSETIRILEQSLELFERYEDKLQELYDLLNDDYSKNLVIKLVAYKLLGHEKVKLPSNNKNYWEKLYQIENIKDKQESIQINFQNWILYKYDLNKFNIPIHLIYHSPGILHSFLLEQYKYKDKIEAKNGDVVVDGGGCWGDTSLYFANKVGESGKVFSFEFIPSNIDIFKKNMSMNQALRDRIELVENPLWDRDHKAIYYLDNGPASRVSFHNDGGFNGKTETKTLDDFFRGQEMQKVDFIKMDIEGAETYALLGAKDTINNNKPKLAIASYHSLEDFVNIPIWIHNLNLDYKIYIDHFTIHWDETVVFASVE